MTTGTTECQISPCPVLSCHRAPAACHAVPMPCHPSCFDTSLAQHFVVPQGLPPHNSTTARPPPYRTHTYNYSMYILLLPLPPPPPPPPTLAACSPLNPTELPPTAHDHHWSLCEHRPGRRTKAVRDPPKSDRHGILSYNAEPPGYRSEAWASCGGPAAQT